MSKLITVTGFTLGRNIDDDVSKYCYKVLRVYTISEDDEGEEIEDEIASTPHDFVADNYIQFFNYKDPDFDDTTNEKYKKDVIVCRTNIQTKKLKVEFNHPRYRSTIATIKVHYMPEPKVKTPENVSSTTEMLAFHEEV